MDAVMATLSVLVGLITGSFLNVVILRLPRGTFRSGGARSHCPHCEAPIAAFDNVPVLSYLLLRGRARCCGKPIHWRYPAIEALTGLCFFLVYLYHAPSVHRLGLDAQVLLRLGVDFAFVAAILAASVIDLEHRILPDAINLPGIVLGFVASLAIPSLHAGDWVRSMEPGLSTPMASLLDAGLGCAIGAGTIYGIAVIGKLVYRTEAMGLGDVKFMAFAGAFIGPRAVLLAMLVAVLLGAVLGLFAALRSGDPRTPFGPFLAVGVLATHFYEEQIASGLLHDFPLWLRTSPYGMPVILLVCVFSLVALLLLRRIRLSQPGDDEPDDDFER